MHNYPKCVYPQQRRGVPYSHSQYAPYVHLQLHEYHRSLGAQLIEAAEHGNTDAVRNLIRAGADVNYSNRHGNTALITAASKGLTPIVDILIENGANINQLNNRGDSALILAAMLQHIDTVNALLNTHMTKVT